MIAALALQASQESYPIRQEALSVEDSRIHQLPGSR